MGPRRHTCETATATEHLVWEVERLWALARELPVERVRVAGVLGYLRGVWATQPQTGRQLADYARRILSVDLEYPIIFAAEGYVMDGLHRIAKAYVLGYPDVKAVRFPQTPEPDERRPRSSGGTGRPERTV
jgi:hypothetical protein